MSTLGIVSLSILVGIFLALVLAFAVYLAYVAWQLKRHITQSNSNLTTLLTTTAQQLTAQQEHLNAFVSQIQGKRLEESAREATLAARDIRAAAVAFGDLAKVMLSTDAIALRQAERAGLGAESYAPDTGEAYVTRSKVALGDAEALRRQLGDYEEPDLTGANRGIVGSDEDE